MGSTISPPLPLSLTTPVTQVLKISHTHTHTHARTHARTFAYTRAHTCTYAHMCTYLHSRIHTALYTYTHDCMHARAHTHARTHARTHKHKYTFGQVIGIRTVSSPSLNTSFQDATQGASSLRSDGQTPDATENWRFSRCIST